MSLALPIGPEARDISFLYQGSR